MPAFSVDLQALLAAVDQMSHFNERLEQSLMRVKSSMATLQPLWRGDADAVGASRAMLSILLSELLTRHVPPVIVWVLET